MPCRSSRSKKEGSTTLRTYLKESVSLKRAAKTTFGGMDQIRSSVSSNPQPGILATPVHLNKMSRLVLFFLNAVNSFFGKSYRKANLNSPRCSSWNTCWTNLFLKFKTKKVSFVVTQASDRTATLATTTLSTSSGFPKGSSRRTLKFWPFMRPSKANYAFGSRGPVMLPKTQSGERQQTKTIVLLGFNSVWMPAGRRYALMRDKSRCSKLKRSGRRKANLKTKLRL
jgi:hypothetical protein